MARLCAVVSVSECSAPSTRFRIASTERCISSAATKTSQAMILSPIHELSYAVLLVSKLQVFSEIWQDDYRSVGTVPGTVQGARSNQNNMHRFHGNTKLCGSGLNFTGRIADGHCAERDPNQSFRTMFFIFPHSAGQRPKGAFGGGGGNITPQV